VIDGLIEAGDLERTAKYDKFKPKKLTAEQVKKIKAKREPEEGWEEAAAEASSKGSGRKGGQSDLFALIQVPITSQYLDAFSSWFCAETALAGARCTDLGHVCRR
jgi:hypothetical protein